MVRGAALRVFHALTRGVVQRCHTPPVTQAVTRHEPDAQSTADQSSLSTPLELATSQRFVARPPHMPTESRRKTRQTPKWTPAGFGTLCASQGPGARNPLDFRSGPQLASRRLFELGLCGLRLDEDHERLG